MPAPLVPPRDPPPGDIGPGGRPRPGSIGTLVADQPSGERIELTRTGPRITRSYLVKDLVGSPDHRLHNAFFVSGIPQMGSFHPAIAGAFVGRVSASHLPDSPTQARVEVEWGFFAGEQDDQFFNTPDDNAVPQLEVSATTVTKIKRKDVNGTPIILNHTFLDIDEDAGTSTPRDGPPQVAAVQFQEPQHIVISRRRETQNPRARALRHLGTINSTSVFGDGPRYWLCTQLDGFTDDRGATWNVTYAFQRNIDTWDAEVIYKNPATGEGVPDPVPDVGTKTVQMYPATDFFLLRI